MIAAEPSAMNQFSDDESRWLALVERDPAADDVFCYSVATTGVYCRPSCAARLAKRENVRFHRTREQAEKAGFRPCKRCRPDCASLADRQRDAVTRACRLIETADTAPNLDELARAAGISRFHFHRLFKASTGVTPKAYVAAHRNRRARSELANGVKISEAINSAGFSSNGRFYETSAQQLGMKPAAYRTGGDHTKIHCSVTECSLGSVLVAETDIGICAIFLGDNRAALIRDLLGRFPKANVICGDAKFDSRVKQVVSLVERPAQSHKLPLDIRGTAFQLRVWQALQRIPAGKTASYAAVASQIGQPNAVRAVARACAANPLAIAIPCHRVIRSNKSPSGYRWGVERKMTLLKREKSAG